jgi:hypothetical protein
MFGFSGRRPNGVTALFIGWRKIPITLIEAASAGLDCAGVHFISQDFREGAP